MEFEVVFVEDEKMPAGFDWALARVGECFYALIRKTRVVPEVLAAAWAAFVERSRQAAEEFLGAPHPLELVIAHERRLAALAN